MFKLHFFTSNAAFDEGGATETARILREVAARYEAGTFEGPIRDSNGNTIGQFYTTPTNAKE